MSYFCINVIEKGEYMRVQSVGSIVNQYAKPKTQNFKGVWGKTTHSFDDGITSHIYDETTHHYYPFLGETAEEISRATSIIERVDNCSPVSDAMPGWDNITRVLVQVERPLPYTADEWDSMSLSRRHAVEERL